MTPVITGTVMDLAYLSLLLTPHGAAPPSVPLTLVRYWKLS